MLRRMSLALLLAVVATITLTTASADNADKDGFEWGTKVPANLSTAGTR